MPWLWVTIPVLAVITFYIYPFVTTVHVSFTKTKPLGRTGRFIGLDNYATILSDPEFWQAVGNSLVYALCVVPLMVLLPLLLALLVKSPVPGISVFRTLYYLPAVSSLVVISLAWRYLLDEQGPVNNLLALIGAVSTPVPFLSDRWLILACAMVITLWQGLPYYMILYLSALANVDTSLYEAAELDGAGPVRRFLTVTVPGVKVMMFLVATLTTIGSLKIFTEVYLLGGAASPTKTLTMYIRDRIVDPTFGSLGQGDAASVCLFLLTFGFIIASQRLQRKAEDQ
ncbi:sugar ABC transporter permease [Schaalia sp. 19OD2882]|uniref:carbohydrate ABC transporter permease n=1 Tax=Schaalia sp. 19OD2882 TaxID=2794089 RepID=UPI001C1EDC5C|nr:sugar ABC transporter permease [Schaalia sp. 19OD2882]QWW19226.1 sugar ABC transporter permease [Schaalia sp. 19OD2882]